MSKLADRVQRILVDGGVTIAHVVDGLCVEPGLRVRASGPSQVLACWLGVDLRAWRGPEAQDRCGEWAKIVNDAAPDLVAVACDYALCVERR